MDDITKNKSVKWTNVVPASPQIAKSLEEVFGVGKKPSFAKPPIDLRRDFPRGAGAQKSLHRAFTWRARGMLTYDEFQLIKDWCAKDLPPIPNKPER